MLHNSTKIPHIKNPLTEVFSFHLSVSFTAWLLSTIRIKIYVVQAQVALAALLSMVKCELKVDALTFLPNPFFPDNAG